MKKFKFDTLFPFIAEESFYVTKVLQMKAKNIYELLKEEENLLHKCLHLRTTANIIKKSDLTTSMLSRLHAGVEVDLKENAQFNNPETISYLSEIINLLYYTKWDNIKDPKKDLYKKLCSIFIGKISTIYNLLNLKENRHVENYTFSAIDNTEMDGMRTIELFIEGKLDVNNVIVNQIKK